MENIKIKKLAIQNFKGIKRLEVDFGKITNIYGDNAEGKTTIFDAFTWLLFGKDSTGRTDFDIKHLDDKGETTDKLEVQVEGLIEYQGAETTIKRVLREKWQTKRGSYKTEFKGNQTDYYFNEVPVKKQEFESNISNLIPEDFFKILSNPTHFNLMDWNDQREILKKLVETKTKEELAKGNSDFEALLERIGKQKTFKEYKAQIKASVKKAAEEIKTIPSRIDEVENSKPAEIDFKAIEGEIKETEGNIHSIDKRLQDASETKREEQKRVNELKTQALNLEHEIQRQKSNIENNAKSKSQDLDFKIQENQKRLEVVNSEIKIFEESISKNKTKASELKNEVSQLKSQNEKLREQYKEKANETLVFDEDEFKCPTCNRVHESDKVEEIKAESKARFNFDKSEELEKINKKGILNQQAIESNLNEIKTLEEKNKSIDDDLKSLNYKKESLEQYVFELKKEFESVKIDSSELNKMISNSEEIKKLKSELESLNKKIKDFKIEGQQDNEELQIQKNELNKKLDELKLQLNRKEEIKRAQKRVEELLKKEQELAKVIGKTENDLYIIEEFETAIMSDLENRINKKFNNIKFKLFDNQINGGIKKTCEALIKGVPYSSANNAAKINAGLEIIKTLGQFYKIYAPIFIDNRESIVRLVDIDTQIINLIVKENQRPLKIETV